LFDLGDDELFDGVEADGAAPDGVERRRGDDRLGENLYQPKRLRSRLDRPEAPAGTFGSPTAQTIGSSLYDRTVVERNFLTAALLSRRAERR
jgi:hypothetical protein